MRHLTDDQIQKLVEEQAADQSQHLMECPQCRDEYDFYMTLNSDMNELELPELSTSFLANVMTQVKARPIPVADSSLSTLMYSLSGVVLTAAVVIYLYGYQNILNYFSNLSLASVVSEANTLSSIKEMISANSSLAGILFFALITVLFFLTLEQLVVRKNQTV